MYSYLSGFRFLYMIFVKFIYVCVHGRLCHYCSTTFSQTYHCSEIRQNSTCLKPFLVARAPPFASDSQKSREINYSFVDLSQWLTRAYVWTSSLTPCVDNSEACILYWFLEFLGRIKLHLLTVLLKVEVQVLAAQKPVERQVGGKESLLYFGCWQRGGSGGCCWRLSKGQLLPTDNQGTRAFIGGWRGLHAETAQSALTVILKLIMWWSDQGHLDCFKYS